ncbi:MAG: tetratricopeptide repeat protein [Treponema sp.]|jgi:tetratricopeptide (TPR) repeat protein|nr:tetratricopeptide repeat protein [Treponema sp.]
MKKVWLGMVLFSFVPLLHAQDAEQSPADALIQQGIYAHDQGDYAAAVEYYQQALELEPDSPLIYYEMAFSYAYDEKYEESLASAEAGIKAAGGDEQYLPALYDAKGSALDNLGRPEEAITVFTEAIRRFGAASLLFYNLGTTYYKLERYDEALDTLTEGVFNNPYHASGNYLLGKMLFDQNRKAQSLLCLYHFLLLEPYSRRSGEAYRMIQQLLTVDTSGGAGTISLTPGSFAALDLLVSMAGTLNSAGEYKEKSEGELFLRKTSYVFTSLAELSGSGALNGGDEAERLWRDFYIPFFIRLTRKPDYLEIFCRYISMSCDKDAEAWLEQRRQEVETFFDWLNKKDEQ